MSNNGLHTETKRVAHHGEATDPGQPAEARMGRTRRALSAANSRLEDSARANPLITAGLLVGGGAILGAVLYAALRPAPTAMQLILRDLERGASLTGHTVRSGLARARRSIR